VLDARSLRKVLPRADLERLQLDRLQALVTRLHQQVLVLYGCAFKIQIQI